MVQSRGGQGKNFFPNPDLFLHMRCARASITVLASLPTPHSWCWVYTDSSKEEGEEEPEPGQPSPPPPPPSQKHIPVCCSYQSALHLDALTLAQAASAWRPCWANSVTQCQAAHVPEEMTCICQQQFPHEFQPFPSALTFHLISQLAQKLGEKEESYSLDLRLVTITYLIIRVPLSVLWASPLLFQYVPGYAVCVECQTLIQVSLKKSAIINAMEKN